ncbi:hypothetical protein TNCV_1691021 [Trichonephila clavipes]|nr:hypothetical protein TNCV_1691021 [Trichonephila clavipes]
MIAQFPCRNCGGGDRGGVAIYRPFGKFRRAKSYCHLYGAQGQRQAYLLSHATMNFVGLDLTTSDRKEIHDLYLTSKRVHDFYLYDKGAHDLHLTGRRVPDFPADKRVRYSRNT